ncbi:MAG: hypothetical protein AAF743_04415 [Planctomycetota bacterium]
MATIKRFLTAVVFIMALNFVAAVGAAAYFWTSADMDGDKFTAIQEIMYPAEEPTTGELETVEDDLPPTSLEQLESLLAVDTTLSAVDRVDAIEEAFTARVEALDRRRRELRDLKAQLRIAQENLLIDRTKVEEMAALLETQTTEAQRLAEDAGFRDTLKLYEGMKAKQVKNVFLDLDDETVVQYLTAMNPRAANKILGEFKTPGEVVRVRQLMELMRQRELALNEPTQESGS